MYLFGYVCLDKLSDVSVTLWNIIIVKFKIKKQDLFITLSKQLLTHPIVDVWKS